MAIILNIDTAVETASVCLSRNSEMIRLMINESRNDHAAWLHKAIQQIINDEGMYIDQIEAIAISMGPGSYTGLRLGLSAAKGLCYALNIPLITIGTLQMMAYSVHQGTIELVCPLIDARRMEVFAAVFDKTLHEIVLPSAMIVDKNSFNDLLSSHHILFCGNGAEKLQSVISHSHAAFSATIATAAHLVYFSDEYFREKKFADLPYCEPFYIKEFYSARR